MWQRIQTLWWVLSIVAIALFATQDILLYEFKAHGISLLQCVQSSTGISPKSALLDEIGIHVSYNNYSVAILSGISIVLSLVSIFIYKMRTFQLRLSILNALVQVGILLAVAYTGYMFTSQAGASFAGITVWLSLPLVGIILQVMAARAVLQDEMLVRMSNRIR